ncbi:MAG: Fic family protein [Bacilli bacterium]|nr:Fic family protein [Bacilli bacterium]MDD3304727.1 Fic family protein [Bacilli bacterium]MDD4053594.1 Fic family protein [Bacilli bacterium]MDD4411093.1 Fic family protein [Bacilli bacterium]
MIDFYFDNKHGVLKNKLNIIDCEESKAAERYYFEAGFKELQRKNDFSAEPEYMCHVHNVLYNPLYTWAGKYRLIDIERSELTLKGLSLQYETYKKIDCSVKSVFRYMKDIRLRDLSMDEKLDQIVTIIINLWHIHPFRDCNTRSLIAFIYQYCSSDSLVLDYNLLINNLEYFRTSLVAASFKDELIDVYPNRSYITGIMEDAFKENYKH